jgi:NitT/TauT family transport system substrate-binding protein
MILAIDAAFPIVAISGVHVGCWELFPHDPVNAVRELRGKTVAVGLMGGPEHIWLSNILAYVGIDPRTEIEWVVASRPRGPKQIFMEGKVDPFLAFPPEPQDLRAVNIGTVALNTITDRPWSQYYCCMVAAHRNFVTAHPNASKRALRAMLKASDICSRNPEGAAKFLVEKG